MRSSRVDIIPVKTDYDYEPLYINRRRLIARRFRRIRWLIILSGAGALVVLLVCGMAGFLVVGGIVISRMDKEKKETIRPAIIKRLDPVEVDTHVAEPTPTAPEDLIVEVKESVLPEVAKGATPIPTIAVPALPPPPNIGGQAGPANPEEIKVMETPQVSQVATAPPLSGWPVGGQITQSFGCSPYFTGLAGPDCPEDAPWFHDGLDIANIAGAPVRAALSGTVIFAEADPSGSECGDWKGYGLVVIIDSGQGWQILYGHLSRIDVTMGQVVIPDSIIGAVGDTGCTTGPHLHFGMNYKGVLVDPSKYVPH